MVGVVGRRRELLSTEYFADRDAPPPRPTTYDWPATTFIRHFCRNLPRRLLVSQGRAELVPPLEHETFWPVAVAVKRIVLRVVCQWSPLTCICFSSMTDCVAAEGRG